MYYALMVLWLQGPVEILAHFEDYHTEVARSNCMIARQVYQERAFLIGYTNKKVRIMCVLTQSM